MFFRIKNRAQTTSSNININKTFRNDEASFIKHETANHQIVVFAKSWCPYCDQTKQLLRRPEFQGVDIRIHDIDMLPNGDSIQAELHKMTGQRTVPNVWVNGEFVGGNDDTQHAYFSGQLASVLAH